MLKLKVNGDIHATTNRELFSMWNEIGHHDLVKASTKAAQSKLPEEWALMYSMLVYSLCGKSSGKGKLNMQQLIVMFGVYNDVNVDAERYIYNEFVSACEF